MPKLFGEVSEEMFQVILPYLTWKLLPGNEHLFHQGDGGDSLSILIAGRLQVFFNREDGTRQFVGEIARGETVGEMSMITGEQRSADVVAVRDSVLVQISRESFEEMITIYPRMVMNITRLIIARLKESNTLRRETRAVVNVAIVPIGEGVDIDGFTRSLSAEVKRYGKPLVLSAAKLGRLLGDAEIANVSATDEEGSHRLSAWLGESELSHDFVFYQADRAPSEWTKRCLRQADEVYLVGNADAAPELDACERELMGPSLRLTTAIETLVLLHPEQHDGNYSGTNAWLENRQVRRCHHLRLNAEPDMQRLARFLTGNAIGLVLAGGGAKGLAHVGIYKALVERGIPVDIVGGTSIGSIIAGLIALGYDAEKIEKDCRQVFMKNPTPIWDYNVIPIVSLLKGKKLDRMLQEVFGAHEIADLLLNFFCVSSSITNTCARIHERGELCKAIRASISLPGIFPPVVDGDDILVDGGIFNNLPIDIMGNMGAGRVIAVDFDLDIKQELTFDRIPSNVRLIRDKLTKKQGHKVPSMMSTIIQSVTINSDFRTRRTRSEADLLFNPDLKRFGLLEWKSYDAIVKAGYEHALRVLESWDEDW